MTIFTFDFGIISFYLYLILYKQYMETILVQYLKHIKFMCMMLKHWDKREVHRAFPSFVPTTYKLYILRHYINIVFIPQKNHINPLTFTF
jgi:hypothetical protein